MKLYLVHHAHAVTAEENPARPLSDQGRVESDRLGDRLKAYGAAPVRILHSDKLWSQQTAERLGDRLGLRDRVTQAKYGIGTGDDLAPFMKEIEKGEDLMMAGHVDYLVRTAARLLCGDEGRMGVEFKPGNGTVFCLEGSGNRWAVTWGWRQDQLAG